MQGCVQNGGTKCRTNKTCLFAQNSIFTSLSGNEGRTKGKKGSCNVQSVTTY